jgi:hypothetical protein
MSQILTTLLVLGQHALTALFLLQQPTLPAAYPRPGTTKMFENDRIIVWNISWLKQTYPLHRHPYDLVGVYYKPGDRMIVSTEGNRRPVSTKAGEIAFQRRGVTHIEEGASDPPLRAVFVEIKDEAPSGGTETSADGFRPGTATKLLDNERARAWEYVSNAGSQPHRHAFDAVVVGLKGDTPQVTFVKRGTMHDDENGGGEHTWVFEIK